VGCSTYVQRWLVHVRSVRFEMRGSRSSPFDVRTFGSLGLGPFASVAVADPDVDVGERASHGVGVNAEVPSDPLQRPALFVELAGFVQVIAEDVLSSQDSDTLEVVHDGGAMNAEFVSKVVDRCAGKVLLDEPGNVRGDKQRELFVAGGETSGWARCVVPWPFVGGV